MPRYMYIRQFDDFYRLPFDEWVEMAKKAADGHGYELPDSAKMKTRPRNILMRGFDSLIEPLDWFPEDFREWLDDHAP